MTLRLTIMSIMAFRMNVNRQLRTDLTDARWGNVER